MILVTNCAHENGIYTYLDEASGLVIKSSYDDEGMRRLEREREGYQWYFDLVGLEGSATLQLVRNPERSYARLKVTLFPGEAGDSYRTLASNKRDLLDAAAYYSAVWPRSSDGLAPLHGDYALSNLIKQDRGLVLVDWEHFVPGGVPWGLDLLNLLYGGLAFTLAGRTSLEGDDRAAFLELRRAVRRSLPARGGIECSLSVLTAFISSNAPVWGGLLQKLPVMNLCAAQVEFVNELDRS